MVKIVEKIECPSCGAPLKIEAGEIIITCEYCGTAVNLKAERPFVLKHSIIPNKYSQKEVETSVRTWMRSGFAMPADLARKARFKEIRLVFLPFYVITASAATEYQGMLTRTGKPKSIKDFISRTYQWTVLGRRSTQFPEREYKTPLSGKSAFDLSLVQGQFLNAELDEDEAQERARTEIGFMQDFLAKEKMDQVQESSHDIQIKDCEFLHAPVWFVDYEYKKNDYHVLLDGATGGVIKGDIPVEESSFSWIWLAAVLVIVAGLLLIFI